MPTPKYIKDRRKAERARERAEAAQEHELLMQTLSLARDLQASQPDDDRYEVIVQCVGLALLRRL